MSNDTMTLAPAAGAGIGKILADRLLAEPDFVDAMIAAAMNGLRATRSFWVKKGGESELVTEADSKIQLHAFALLLSHMEGEPIKRIIHQHLGANGQIDVTGALRDSPALQAALERELEKAQWRTSGNKPHKRPAKKASQPAIDGEAEIVVE